MIRQMQRERLALKTQEASVAAVAGLAKYSGCSPDQLNPEQLRTSLPHLLVERQQAWSTCHQVACGLRFFSTQTLGWEPLQRNLPPRTKPSQLPHVLRAAERQRLFSSAKTPKHRALLMTTSAAGLRGSEVVPLQVTDLESARGLIRVNQGKGRKDRSTLLSVRLVAALRAYWRRERSKPWLFPGRDRARPMPIASAQRIYDQATDAADLQHGKGLHTLRHSFATPLREAGGDPRTSPLVLGHRSLDTPARYLRVARTHLAPVHSSCDLLRVDTLPPLAQDEGHGPPAGRWSSFSRRGQRGRPKVGSRCYPAPLWPHLRRHTPCATTHQKSMHDLRACRTAALGGHAEQCGQCGFERSASNACRNRHCPTCQTLRKEQWLADRRADLLEGPYFPCVFTLPHDLNALVLRTKRALCTLLLHATSQTLLQFGHHNLGGQLGGILLWHTWAQTLKAPFHGHALVPGGALVEKGTRWGPTPPRFLCPVHALRTVFRATCLDALHDRRAALVVTEHTASLETAHGFHRFLARLSDKAWGGYAKRPLAGPEQVLDYLGRYTHRVAIANHRLIDGQDGQVRFRFRNRRQDHRRATMPRPAQECIRRLLLHVVPHGLQRLRPIGFLANRCQAKALRQCRQQRKQPEPARARQKTVAAWMWQLTGTDVTQCPHCGHGPLKRLPLARLPPRPESPGRPSVWDASCAIARSSGPSLAPRVARSREPPGACAPTPSEDRDGPSTTSREA